MAQGLTFPANSFRDLDFLVPSDFKEGDSVPPFLIFIDSKREAETACKAFRKRWPRSDCDKIHWFHSNIMQNEREQFLEKIRSGVIFSLFCTDAFRMVCTTQYIQS
jgi:superfamily II DNA/RNA helicase